MKLRVWFNHDYSAVSSEIQALLQHEATLKPQDRIIQEIHSAHCEQDFSGSSAIHMLATEPEYSSPKQYLAWALAYAKANRIDYLVLGQHYELMIGHLSDFRAIGVELLFACSLKELAVVDVKSDFYHRLEQGFYADMVPFWKIWNGEYRTTFEDSIKSAQSRGCTICVKPACRLEGDEFFTCRAPEQRRHFMPTTYRLLPSPIIDRKHDWLVMEYLPGPEYEVDCLAWKGQLRHHESVALSTGNQAPDRVNSPPELTRQLQVLAREFGLSGLFRATFRQDEHGRFKVLGVNPRNGGGSQGRAVVKGSLIWEWLHLADSGQSLPLVAKEKPQERTATRKPSSSQLVARFNTQELSYAAC